MGFGERLANATYLEGLEGLSSSVGSNAQWVGISAQEYQNGTVRISDAQAIRSVATEVGFQLEDLRFLSISPSNPLTENLDALRDLDFVVAGRFHVAVLSLLAGIPVVAVSPSNKLRSLADKLNLVQIHNTTDFRSLTTGDFQIDKSACLRESREAQFAAEKFKIWLRQVST
jgi:polysaccharide pyruvyl transferase WcaK-like protein